MGAATISVNRFSSTLNSLAFVLFSAQSTTLSLNAASYERFLATSGSAIVQRGDVLEHVFVSVAHVIGAATIQGRPLIPLRERCRRLLFVGGY